MVTVGPICVHVEPLGEVKALNDVPDRMIIRYSGNVMVLVGVIRDSVAPGVRRSCTTMPLPGVARMVKLAAPALLSARNISPAFAHALVLVCETIRALILPFAATALETNWN